MKKSQSGFTQQQSMRANTMQMPYFIELTWNLFSADAFQHIAESHSSGDVLYNFAKHLFIPQPSLLPTQSLRNRPVILPPSPYRLTANKPICL